MDLQSISSLLPRAFPAAEKHQSDKAHGIIMALTVVLILPLGAMSRKLLRGVVSSRARLLVHIWCQALGVALLITGLGIGGWAALVHAEVYNDPNGHVILGTIIVILFLIQPFIGVWHHHLYKNNQASRTLNLTHVWFGRCLLILGMVNGGVGLFLAANTPGGEIAYGVVAGIIGVTYIALIVAWSLRKRGKSSDSTSAGESDEVREVEGGTATSKQG